MRKATGTRPTRTATMRLQMTPLTHIGSTRTIVDTASRPARVVLQQRDGPELICTLPMDGDMSVKASTPVLEKVCLPCVA